MPALMAGVSNAHATAVAARVQPRWISSLHASVAVALRLRSDVIHAGLADCKAARRRRWVECKVRGIASTPREKAARALSDELIAELRAADTIVIGAPMYNFGVPSQLKAWIDRIAVAGRTFRYSPAGHEGLAGGKRVIIASARGGLYAGTPRESMDFQEAYLRQVFTFLGITEIEVVRAEGIGLGPDQRSAAIAAAKAAIVAEPYAVAA